ncbi:hypothetical protein SUVZ_04G3720 [Saccharomyces uvarum]|uniref:Mannosyl phosphorylinositol ceramide synthase SUR1 n=1 Tax=Saccharomyces uvarum TaxID=230603 RepID=A0ABN8WWY7_SACUV|nr:hypothetical protein SUVZ_04G3720 [Saccharomyces uvarum]
MKKELKFLIIANAVLLFSIIHYTFDLLTLCIDDASKDALLDEELNPAKDTDSKFNETHPQLIPKIIHQTYKTNIIPEQWVEGRQKCVDLHPDYTYILWTDEMAQDFIEQEYSWFLDTFKSYKYPIERADAIRYFILLHYGGIYIDLDDGCERKLDPLLTVPAFLRKTSPTGVSNDVMGSVPGHPFFLKVIESLKHYDKNWYVPYMTIMGSTGPLFISVIWKQYKRWSNAAGDNAVRILQPADYKMHANSFFAIAKGSSWHTGDANFMKILENHILSCVVTGFIFGFFILYGEFTFYSWLCSGPFNTKRYTVQWLGDKLKLLRSKITLSSDNDVEKTPAPLRYEYNSKGKRLRKDSNIPYDSIFIDIEKNHPEFTDLS